MARELSQSSTYYPDSAPGHAQARPPVEEVRRTLEAMLSDPHVVAHAEVDETHAQGSELLHTAIVRMSRPDTGGASHFSDAPDFGIPPSVAVPQARAGGGGGGSPLRKVTGAARLLGAAAVAPQRARLRDCMLLRHAPPEVREELHELAQRSGISSVSPPPGHHAAAHPNHDAVDEVYDPPHSVAGRYNAAAASATPRSHRSAAAAAAAATPRTLQGYVRVGRTGRRRARAALCRRWSGRGGCSSGGVL